MDDDTGAAKPPAEIAAETRALVRALLRWRDKNGQPSDKESDPGRYVQLARELFEIAEKSLLPKLIEDGASPDDAREACRDLAGATALFRDERERGVDPYAEMRALNAKMIALRAEIDGLSPDAKRVLDVWLTPTPPRRPKGLFGAPRPPGLNALLDMPSVSPATAYRQIVDGLPRVIEALEKPKPNRGGKDIQLHALIKQACGIWARRTGQYPTSRTDGGAAKAPLFDFLASNAGVYPLSPDVWRSCLKEEREFGSRIALLGEAVRPGRRKPGRKPKAK